MELTGEHRIPAPREKVWEALHAPEILQACITGCEALEMAPDGTIKAKVTAKVGPVKAKFDADAQIVNAVPPHSYTLQGEGKGGVAGFAKGSADVSLAPDGEDTILTYHAKANVGGKLAQLGSRLVDSTAKRYASDFFKTFSAIVGGTGTVDTAATAIEAGAAPAPETPVAAPATPAASAPAASVPPHTPTTATPPTADVAQGAPAPSGGSRLWIWFIVAAVVLGVIVALN